MRSYEHTHTADLSASLSCSAAVAEKVQDPAQHGSWSVSTTDAEEAGDIPASFKDMMRRLLERHEFHAIVAVANDLLADHPDSLYLHFALGTAHSNLEQNRQCIRHCRRFLEIQAKPHERSFKHANITGIQNNLALALKDLGMLTGAGDAFRSLLQVAPDYVPALVNYGNLLNETARLEEAREHFVRAIEINPEDHLAYWNLHSTANDIDTARAILEICLSKNPKNELAIMTLAGLHAFTGDRSHVDTLAHDGFADDPIVRSIEWVLSLPETPQVHFNRWSMFDTALAHANRSRAFYEFGVWMGDSFRYLIDHFPQGYGFDTFEGLPEEWHGLPRGSYTSFGDVPNILGAEFVVGEFKDTLPEFFADERPMAGLINFDADLYSSTITALNNAKPVIDSSTVLVFDEFIVNKNWEHDEFRALEEFCAIHDLSYEVLAVSLFTKQMACRLR
ncbi:MAG: protein arginine N-methyltransferase [Alphaproteobacteria bacterium]